MFFKSDSVQMRLTPIRREEFFPERYRPGVISFSRIVWGSLGGGLLLAIIAFFSSLTGIEVLYPPLAATCFINTTCVFLRVARPKSVIIGHFVASIGGLAGVWLGSVLGGGTEYVIVFKLGFAVMFAAVLMQLFDADHPPAAATAAIPAVLPLPMPAYLLPINMAWAGTLAVLFSLAWNRLWFDFPAKDVDNQVKTFGLHMSMPQIKGVVLCVGGFIFMSFNQILPLAYTLGGAIMLLGLFILGTHHIFEMKRTP